jgi:hypothetical protein
MSILSVYRRTGGGYVFSPEPMTARQTRDYAELLVGIGIVESETLGPNLAAIVARQLAQSAYAVVSATLFDEGRGTGS